jgi:hypothetical protein
LFAAVERAVGDTASICSRSEHIVASTHAGLTLDDGSVVPSVVQVEHRVAATE